MMDVSKQLYINIKNPSDINTWGIFIYIYNIIFKLQQAAPPRFLPTRQCMPLSPCSEQDSLMCWTLLCQL